LQTALVQIVGLKGRKNGSFYPFRCKEVFAIAGALCYTFIIMMFSQKTNCAC